MSESLPSETVVSAGAKRPLPESSPAKAHAAAVDSEVSNKKPKLDSTTATNEEEEQQNASAPAPETPILDAPHKSLLPPSTFLFRGTRPEDGSAEALRPPVETDVGILEYVGREIAPFQGIIKQR